MGASTRRGERSHERPLVPENLLFLQNLRDPFAGLDLRPRGRVHGNFEDEQRGRRLHQYTQKIPCRSLRAKAEVMHLVSVNSRDLAITQEDDTSAEGTR